MIRGNQCSGLSRWLTLVCLVSCLTAWFLLSAPVRVSALPTATYGTVNQWSVVSSPGMEVDLDWSKTWWLHSQEPYHRLLAVPVVKGKKYSLWIEYPGDHKEGSVLAWARYPYFEPDSKRFCGQGGVGHKGIPRNRGTKSDTTSEHKLRNWFNIRIMPESESSTLWILYTASQPGAKVKIKVKSPPDPEPEDGYAEIISPDGVRYHTVTGSLLNLDEVDLCLRNGPDGSPGPLPTEGRPGDRAGGQAGSGASGKRPQSPTPPATKPGLSNPPGTGGAASAGWRIGEKGYASIGADKPHWSAQPTRADGCLKLQVYGGYQWASKDLPVTDLSQTIRARFKVNRWSTYDGGLPMGYAGVSFGLIDAKGEILSARAYYLDPRGKHRPRPKQTWVKLGSGRPTPTSWQVVNENLAQQAKKHGIDPAQVSGVRLRYAIFGTHEDRKPTVACFGGYAFSDSAEGGIDGGSDNASSRPVVKLERTDVAPGQSITVHFSGAGGLPPNGWIGIVPSDVPHGDERTNDDHDLAYRYLEGRGAGSVSFKAPERPGKYDLRVHDTDNDGRELASVSFRVVHKDQGPSEVGSFSGTWDTNFGIMTMSQQGTKVSGTYTHDEGRIKGTVKDGILTGTWYEAPTYSPPQDSGEVVLRLLSGGQRFSGSWGYGDKTGEGTWDGTRK